jgi:hypothetical protein
LEARDFDVEDEFLVGFEVFLLFAPDVDVGFGEHRRAQIEVLLYTVPVGVTEAALAEGVDGRACHNVDIRHHQAWMVGRQVGVDRIREDPIPVVDEEDEKEGDNSDESQLQSGSKLLLSIYIHRQYA